MDMWQLFCDWYYFNKIILDECLNVYFFGESKPEVQLKDISFPINKTNEHQEFPKRLNPQVRLQAKP